MKKEKVWVYQEIQSLNTAIKIVVWLYVACQIVMMPVSLWFWQQMKNMMLNVSQSQVHDAAAENLDGGTMLTAGLLVLTVLVFITSAILIGVWIYRSHKNAKALQIQGIEQSPAWAVGGFFVPIANLFVPYRAMKSLVSGSLNALGKENINLVGYWWAAWILGNGISRVSDSWSKSIERALPENPTPEQFLTYLADMQQTFYLDGISGVLLIASALLLLSIIKTVNQTHQALAKQNQAG